MSLGTPLFPGSSPGNPFIGEITMGFLLDFQELPDVEYPHEPFCWKCGLEFTEEEYKSMKKCPSCDYVFASVASMDRAAP